MNIALSTRSSQTTVCSDKGGLEVGCLSFDNSFQSQDGATILFKADGVLIIIVTFIFETWCKGELLAWKEGRWKPVNGLFLHCIYRRKYLFEVLLLFETRYGGRDCKYKEFNRSWCKFRMTGGVKDWNGLPSWINSDAQIIRISKCLRQFWMFSFWLARLFRR